MIVTIRDLLWDYSDEGKQNAYALTTMSDSSSFSQNDFLASNADLVQVLAHFADSSRRHSVQYRRDHEFVETALSTLLPTGSPADQLPPPRPVVAPDASLSAPQRTAPRNAAVISDRSRSVEVREGIPRSRRRQHCECGQCRWCLDNARWDRIFNEKFADPAYYGRLVVRHNSTLAGAW